MGDEKYTIDLSESKEEIELISREIYNIRKYIIENKDFYKEFGQQLKNVFMKFKPLIDEFNRTLIQIINNIDFIKLNENQKELAIRMIKNGWYFSLILPLTIGELLEMNEEDLNTSLSIFYEEGTERICNSVIDTFPDRKIILEKCFKAHKNGDYELSIPVMFAQADGISKDIFNMNLFNKKHGKPLTSEQKVITFNEESFVDMPYLIQLSITGELNGNGKKSKYLNRHNVLHGTDTEYATKSNSLRCISMLNFLAELKEYYIIKDK
ncbi:hypothetical protein [Clostridium botulinum]|uniref:hypothetical protein n=1 Tax=Clostridium botulinum TaxID=1491 RepID=UPI003DA636DA